MFPSTFLAFCISDAGSHLGDYFGGPDERCFDYSLDEGYDSENGDIWIDLRAV